MSVVRVDLNKCIGCESCVKVCPMDVFYFNHTAHKSVIAYPENCQSCGQCYVHCQGRSLGMTNDMFAFAIPAMRSTTTAPMNRIIVTEPGALTELTKGNLP